MEVDPLPKGLDCGEDAGDKTFAPQGLEVDRKALGGATAEIPKEPTSELEEDPKRLGNDENHLSMRDIKKERFQHPLFPLLKPLSMTRRAEAPGLAGERQQVFRMAVRTPYTGKARARIAAIEVALDHLLDDRPGIAILFLEAALIFGKETFEMMENHPIEDGSLRMARTIDSRHSGK